MKIIECRNCSAGDLNSFFLFCYIYIFSAFQYFQFNIQVQYIIVPVVLLTQETIKDDYFANVKDKLRQFDTFLGDKPFFAGDSVSISFDI